MSAHGRLNDLDHRSPSESLQAFWVTPTPPEPTATETRSQATEARLQPCSLVSAGLVGATLPGTVTGMRELAADDFLSPPVGGFVACAYETNSRFGELTMVVEPMERNQYEARYVERDPANTRKVPNVGEAAGFSGCGSLSVYSNSSSDRHPVC
jgi:hypothetical protein